MKTFNILFNERHKVGDVLISKDVVIPMCDNYFYFIIIRASIFNPIRRLFKKPYKYKCIAITENPNISIYDEITPPKIK